VTGEAPAELEYRPELVTRTEEAELTAWLGDVEFREIAMRGQVARRTVRHYGLSYEYETARVTSTEPLPAELAWVRDRCAVLAGLSPEELAQTLVTRYPAGAPIGWHHDAPVFGTIVGLSLGAACRMRFQRGTGAERRVFELALEPRSAHVLAGEVREDWQHSIPPVKDLRYSITFRTLRPDLAS
jgi:alkylated DNA repair protein (DNA oxidative demethylase)